MALTVFGESVLLLWNTFNTNCADNSGSSYSGQPLAALMVMVPGGSTSAVAFDFCVNGFGAVCPATSAELGPPSRPVWAAQREVLTYAYC